MRVQPGASWRGRITLQPVTLPPIDRPPPGHPAFALKRVEDESRLRREFIRRMSPEWTQRAACAGQPVAAFFTDEVADTDPLQFPETVYDALRTCAGCPVARECVTQAYEVEKPLALLDPWASATDADDDRFGVWGVPGRIREKYAAEPDRVGKSLAWLDSVALQRRWKRPGTQRSEIA